MYWLAVPPPPPSTVIVYYVACKAVVLLLLLHQQPSEFAKKTGARERESGEFLTFVDLAFSGVTAKRETL